MSFSSPKTDPINDQVKVKQYLQDLSWLGLQYEHRYKLCGFVFPAAGSSHSYLIYHIQLLWMESFFSRDTPLTLRTAQLKDCVGRGRGDIYHATQKEDLDPVSPEMRQRFGSYEGCQKHRSYTVKDRTS